MESDKGAAGTVDEDDGECSASQMNHLATCGAALGCVDKTQDVRWYT